MESENAKEIIRMLADGTDPTTGEALPDSSPYNAPLVIRAYFTVLEALGPVKKRKKTIEEKQQDNIDAGRPKNAGLPWTDEMKSEIASKALNGASMEELSRHFERTQGSIISELMRQGLIPPGDEPGRH